MPRLIKAGKQVFNLDQVACIQYDEENERAILYFAVYDGHGLLQREITGEQAKLLWGVLTGQATASQTDESPSTDTVG